MITDEGQMLTLGEGNLSTVKQNWPKATLTPFMIGIRDAGSIHIDASSKKTTGKSITVSATEAELMQVVQI